MRACVRVRVPTKRTQMFVRDATRRAVAALLLASLRRATSSAAAAAAAAAAAGGSAAGVPAVVGRLSERAARAVLRRPRALGRAGPITDPAEPVTIDEQRRQYLQALQDERWRGSLMYQRRKRALVAARSEQQRALAERQAALTPAEKAQRSLVASARSGNVLEAKKAYDELVALGQPVTAHIASAMLSAHVRGGTIASATEFMYALRRAQPELVDVSLYNLMIRLGAVQRRPSVALDWLRKLRQAGVAPDVVTFASLLPACRRKSHVDVAVGLLRDMHSRGLTPSREQLATIARAYQRAERSMRDEAVDRARSFVASLRAKARARGAAALVAAGRCAPGEATQRWRDGLTRREARNLYRMISSLRPEAVERRVAAQFADVFGPERALQPFGWKLPDFGVAARRARALRERAHRRAVRKLRARLQASGRHRDRARIGRPARLLLADEQARIEAHEAYVARRVSQQRRESARARARAALDADREHFVSRERAVRRP